MIALCRNLRWTNFTLCWLCGEGDGTNNWTVPMCRQCPVESTVVHGDPRLRIAYCPVCRASVFDCLSSRMPSDKIRCLSDAVPGAYVDDREMLVRIIIDAPSEDVAMALVEKHSPPQRWLAQTTHRDRVRDVMAAVGRKGEWWDGIV